MDAQGLLGHSRAMTTPPASPEGFALVDTRTSYPTLPVQIGVQMGAHYNPRTWDRREFRNLRRSIRRWGTVEPVVINLRTRRIVGGHMRLRAAMAERLEAFPYVTVDLDEVNERLLNVALNRIGGDWDERKLQALVVEIEDGDGDLTLTGLSESEMDDLVDDDDLILEDMEAIELADTPRTVNRRPEDYGAATSLVRGSAPLAHWKALGHLEKGRVLDFGAGQDVHEFSRYDAFYAPDPAPLLESWDVVMSNYVLNVQPSDHLIDLILALIARLLEPKAIALVAVLSDPKLSGTAAVGGRTAKSPAEWKAILDRFFRVRKAPKASFTGFECRPR